jgi:hypothetical protein
MTAGQIYGLKAKTAAKLPQGVVVCSTADGCDSVVVVNADPVALAIERRKRDR